jgi:hypothetical protein
VPKDNREPANSPRFGFPMQRKRSMLTLVASGAIALGGLARAADAPAATPPNGPSPILAAPAAPAPSSTPSRRSRVISPEVAAQLSAATPQFAPPPPKPPVSEEEQVDLRDTDKPKNGIIRLPKFVVHEKPPPVLSEKVVFTQKGLADIAMRRYLSEFDRALNRFTIPLLGGSAEARALAMYAEDERLKNISDLHDDAGMVSTTDKAAGAYVRRQANQATMHDPAFDWHPIGR